MIRKQITEVKRIGCLDISLPGQAPGEVFLPGQWLPTRPPERIMKIDEKPELSFDEEFGNLERSRELMYLKSGRYDGVFESEEASKRADPYRYARVFSGGKLPWEIKGNE